MLVVVEEHKYPYTHTMRSKNLCDVDFLLPQFGDKSSCTNTVLAVTVWKREAVKRTKNDY